MTPDEFTIKEQFIDVGDGHQLYVHDWGNKNAKYPIVFLHGGPGSNCRDKHKANFDPTEQRVVFFDQRGSGKSLPKGELKANTSEHMVEDIESIIQALKIDKVTLTGGSWGSCLALLFGIKYPHRVHAMVLNGIFTARQKEIDHLDKGGFKLFYPDLWDKYVKSVPESHKNNPSEYYYKDVFGDDQEKAKKAAYTYSEMLEGPLLSLDDRYTPDNYEDFESDGMKIEMHYLKNRCFLPENYIFKNASKLKMPIWLVQGRYDMVCPPETAYELSKLLPDAKLIWTINGHMIEREASTLFKVLHQELAN